MHGSNERFSSLNPQQRSAASHQYGPLLILAGAGSGKTTVLVSRTTALIQDKIVTPREIAVMTFTNKAARELKDRVKSKLGKKAQALFAGTFHRFGLDILREFHKECDLPKRFGIVDGIDAKDLCREILRNLRVAGKDGFDLDTLLELVNTLRAKDKLPLGVEESYAEAAEWLVPKYEERLADLGVVDFEGLLLHPLRLLQNNKEARETLCSRYSQIMVDEFQDTNKTQLRLIQTLAAPHENLTVVGDDDQSIYGWRGACIGNILNFPKLYPKCKVIKLEINYRSTSQILNLANHAIAANENRHPKTLRTSGEKTGPLPRVLDIEEETFEAEQICAEVKKINAQQVPFSETALLFRSNSHAAKIEAELRAQNIPYKVTGGTALFDRKEPRDVLAYLRCALRPDELSFRRILNTPPRGIGPTTVKKLVLHAERKGTSLFQAAKNWQSAGLDGKAGKNLEKLFQDLNRLPQLLIDASSVSSALSTYFKELGYYDYLGKISRDALAVTKRWRWVEVLAESIERSLSKNGKNRKGLLQFLENMELRDSEDDEEKKDELHLLTLHTSKGLEWSHVVFVGVEEDLLPHRTLGSDVDEERRLFYVGITRAKNELILTRTKKRKKHSKEVECHLSRFFESIPKDCYDRKTASPFVSSAKSKSYISQILSDLSRTE